MPKLLEKEENSSARALMLQETSKLLEKFTLGAADTKMLLCRAGLAPDETLKLRR